MRSRSNCQRIRRPLGVREVLRAVTFVACVAGGVAFTLRLGPFSDVIMQDLAIAQGLFAGTLIGFMVASQIRPSGR
jgi:energy-converting hydrogenase Eha subunit C